MKGCLYTGLLLLLEYFGSHETCTEVGQVCYKCRGDISVCNDGSFSYTTADDCISYIMSTPSKLSAHYKPSNSKCFPYTCTTNVYFSDSTRFTIRKTCNGDCTNFTLSQYTYKRITEPALSTYAASRGQCFADCFETIGCYTFSYAGGVCSLYTTCGISCSMVSEASYTEVYTRMCHTVTDCGSLDNPSNGVVDTSSGTAYTFQAVYSCSNGYQLNGDSTRTCQANAQWSGTEPTCDVIDCGPLTAQSNGNVDTPLGTTFNNVATYTCSNGYQLNGDSTRTCQANAQWNGTEPTCDAIDCGPLTAQYNGNVDTPLGTTFNNVATYTCSNGYQLNGDSTRTCQANAQWNGTEPTCDVIDCGPLTAQYNGNVDTPLGTTFNNVATYTCSNGYQLNGDSTRTCQANAQWSGTEPTCDAIDCGPLSAQSNGNVDTPLGTTFNNVATYTCSNGYNMTGTSTRTCHANAQWSGTEPTCDAIDCGPLTAPSNGNVDTASGTTFNSVATYTCSSGYNLTGSSSRTCEANTQWSDTEPTCSLDDCGPLPALSNGYVDTTSGTTFNNVATYTCTEGYTMIGANTRICQEGGQWNGSAPVCTAKDCGSLTSPVNGAVDTPAGTTYSSQATYTCSTGYILQGNEIRMCQSNSSWSGSEPSCSIVDCGNLTAPENGIMHSPTSTTYQEEIRVTCIAGYNLTGSSARMCLANGTWNGSQPVCNPVDCGMPEAPVNGTVSNNGTTFGQTATFSCNSGFSLSDLAVTTCNASGFWYSTPTCSITDCGLLLAPENGIIEFPLGTTYGGTALFQCNAGYYLSHVNSRTCQSNGFWSASTPLCVQNGVSVPEPTKLYLAPCICYSNKTFTDMTQEEILRYLIRETRIPPNSTGLARRKLNSVQDSRTSSKLIGYAGLFIILGPLGLILLSDVLFFFQHCSERRYLYVSD